MLSAQNLNLTRFLGAPQADRNCVDRAEDAGAESDMGKLPKDQPRRAMKQIERELLALHGQLNRIADLVDAQHAKLTDLIVRVHSLNEEPVPAESP
jgi:hypothetical protein